MRFKPVIQKNMKNYVSLDWKKPAAISFFMVTSICAVLLNKALFVNYKVSPL
jgi:hypothetical protein